jgi:hypothetical protein
MTAYHQPFKLSFACEEINMFHFTAVWLLFRHMRKVRIVAKCIDGSGPTRAQAATIDRLVDTDVEFVGADSVTELRQISVFHNGSFDLEFSDGTTRYFTAHFEEQSAEEAENS